MLFVGMRGYCLLSPYYVPVVLRALGGGCCHCTHFTDEGTETRRGKVTYPKLLGSRKQGLDTSLSYHNMPAWGVTAQLLGTIW